VLLFRKARKCVVLATVSHLNDFVFHLTMTDSQGDSTTIGVTGYHKIYTEDQGWVEADDLYDGELVRSDNGDVTVTGLSSDPGTYRVYNLDVEDDHVTTSAISMRWCIMHARFRKIQFAGSVISGAAVETISKDTKLCKILG
jgi:hypothetical protein